MTLRCLSHLSLAGGGSSFQASLLASIFSPLAALALVSLPSAPNRASPCAASIVKPLRLILLIQIGTLLLRAVKKSQYAVHALRGLVVDGSSHIFSMPATASNSPLSISQFRSLSLQFCPPGRSCGISALWSRSGPNMILSMSGWIVSMFAARKDWPLSLFVCRRP